MVKDKAAKLTNNPGVYLFKNKSGEIIYVGKAARLKTRVSQYFTAVLRDSREKIHLMMPLVSDIKVIETPSEMEALFLESELIKRYQPKYNSEWKDERNFLYIRINYLFDYPSLEFVRRPFPDRATYIGPFIDAHALKKSLRYLRRVFPYSTHHKTLPKKACLDFHIGLCPGVEISAITSKEYKKNLRKLEAILQGKKTGILKELKKQMNELSKKHEFEKAAQIRDRINGLESLAKRVVFGLSEKYEVLSDEGLVSLQNALGIDKPLKRIEAYDISNISGTNPVGSMVVFQKGVPRRDHYRRFKIKKVRGINDFAMMHEVLTRRFKNDWPMPDLVVIDGGKGQLSAALAAMTGLNIHIPAIGLAKREEEIVTIGENELLKTKTFKIIKLSHKNPGLKLLQRIRDEAHRFAVIFHRSLRGKKMLESNRER